ncbi:hypothetical protein IWZ03DRAFT_375200 [Phyllosticta citriasiana]|uniref:Polymerase nucleotidyl transferase domain-containing protein n=1 Tax=Phyllosticta citriasiana TaxID=595635 RepID=A0ABR1KQ06_9PEZI
MYATLQASGIKFGIFGGYAVSVLGGNRESKDVDCIVSVSKQEILHILDGKNGFKALPQTREDYVAFLWSENPTELVEIFCAKFPGSRYTLQNIQATIHTVSGAKLGTKPASFLDPFHIFKGKLHAAATRGKIPRCGRPALARVPLPRPHQGTERRARLAPRCAARAGRRHGRGFEAVVRMRRRGTCIAGCWLDDVSGVVVNATQHRPK